jgi:DNA-binding GntR family transcriptional regulator
MLEQEGLVRVDPRQGVRVVAGDTSTLLSAYQLRDVVDGLAARLVAQTSDGERLDELHRAIDDQRVALAPWDPEQYTTANISFHSTILQMSGNEFLVGQIPLLRMTARIFSPVSLIDRSAAEVAVTQHQGILQAIEAGQPTLAETHARGHIGTTIHRLEELLAGEDTGTAGEDTDTRP